MIFSQYGHRKRRLSLRGDAAKSALQKHQSRGLLAYRFAVGVTILGLATNFFLGYRSGEGFHALFPSGLHGWFGLLGLWVLTFVVNKGKRVGDGRERNESVGAMQKQHGKASDIMMVLIALHAFLGFIYLFNLVAL